MKTLLKYLIILFIDFSLLITFATLYSQTLSISNPDISGFPNIKAQFFASDVTGFANYKFICL